jgi:hypothetical protein
MAKPLTKEELLEKLKDAGYKFEVSGNKIKVLTSEDRMAVLEKIKSLTKGTRVSEGSSIGSIALGAIKILVKPSRTSHAGSGAGAYITSLAESAQCYYCAAAWYNNDFSEKSLRAAAKYVQATASIDQVLKELPDNWVESCTKSATVLYGQFGTKRYTFHRGSAYVQKINTNFMMINREQSMFSNINKWSPADIWMVSDKANKVAFDFEDFNTINAFLLKMAKNKELLGVSLKQTNSAIVRRINFTGETHSYKFMEATVGKKGFFESKDIYLFYDGGEIQFRGFPTWQGEIKGKTANHGKISGGPTKAIVDRYSPMKLDSQAQVEAAIKRKDKNFYKKFHDLYQKTVGKIKYDDFVAQVSNKDVNWQSSKYLGTQLVYIMNTNKKRQIILSEFINYAKSQSSLSAPHIKVE